MGKVVICLDRVALDSVGMIDRGENVGVKRDWESTDETCINPVNEYRVARVAEVLSDFQSIQYYIAAAPVDPQSMDDYYTEGWAALRQCNLDGQHILNCGADTSVPQARGGAEEQSKAELQQ